MSGNDRVSRSKHRRDHSDDDDDAAEKTSKHHKHRHHRHRHISKTEADPTPEAPPTTEDVEEGEIRDFSGGGGDDGVVLETKTNSGAESGEIEPIENPDDETRSPIGVGKKYHSEDVDVDRSNLANKEKSIYRNNGDGHGEKLRSRSRSGSHGHVRERSRSRSVVEEEAPSRRRSRSRSILEEESLSKRRRYHDRESSAERRIADERVSYSRHSGLDRLEREKSREREVDRVRRREKELERNSERDRRRDKDRERSERDPLRDRKRGSFRDDSSERVVDRESRRDEQYRSRDWTREDDVDRSRGRGKAADRDIHRDSDRDRDRDNDRVADREWERRHDRYRDNGRDMTRERSESEGAYGSQNKYNHSGQSRYEEKENNQDGSAQLDPDKVQVVREEDEQGDDDEMVGLQVADQEEEELNRIKEESMRRKQAILEKHKHKAYPLVQSTGVVKFDAEVDGPLSSGGVYTEEATTVRQNGAPGLGEGTPKSESSGGSEHKQERTDGILCDDIFGETPTEVRKMDKGEVVRIERSGLRDNWDDAEGYYSYRFGELLDGRYEITAAHGKGVFSTVVRAKNLKAGNGEPEEVAIKMIRSNDTMYKAGMTELTILKKLGGQDPDNKRYCVRFLSSFKYRNHLCLVFESLHMNLRELLKKFGRNIGLNLTAVRIYAKQLLIALKHLKNCGVLHCDIKPDNMLVNEAKNVLKLCDFGNAMFAGENEVTPYLVSRFYRAPEIILGLPYDHPLDIWSVGCCLFELYTGKVLFPGATNNDMLRLHMELKGPFPKKMLRKGAFTHQNFDQDLNFHATEDDPVTKKVIKRVIFNIKPKDIGSMIATSSGEDPDPKLLADFKDLLDKMFVLDPEKRLTVSQGLNHPFITGK